MAPKPARGSRQPAAASATPSQVPNAGTSATGSATGVPTLTWAGELQCHNAPHPRCNGAAFFDGHRLLTVGGFAPDANQTNDLTVIEQLDLGTLTWTEIETSGQPHPAASQFSAVDVGGAVLFFGGWTGTSRSNDLTLLQLDNATWSAYNALGDRPPPLTFHSASVVNKKMYLYGGNTTDSQCGDVHVFDLQTTAWGVAPNLGAPPKRSSHSASVLHDHHLVIFGGRGESASLLNDVAVFDASSNHWVIGVKVDGVPPPPRYGHSASVVGNNILVFGGVGENGKLMNDLWLLRVEKPNQLLWSAVITEGPPPASRASHYALETLTALYIVHGRTDQYGAGISPTIWVLETSGVAPLPPINAEHSDEALDKSSTPVQD